MLQAGMRTFRKALLVASLFVPLLALAACSSDNDNAHTTATTIVPPPAQQVLHVETRPGPKTPAKPDDPKLRVDASRPLLIFNLPNGKTFRQGDEVVVDFSLANAKLKGDGGDFRLRYIIDDGELQWLDRWEQIVLTGWQPGNHTIRLELIGPDGWPYRNGDYNVVTREITVVQ